MKLIPKYKSLELSVKSVDTTSRIVSGYASAFGNVDSDGDMMVKGCYAKTIAERGPSGKNEIFFLRDHSTSKVLGKPSVLKEDDYGLYFEAKISNTDLGNDTLSLYQDGVINQHSVGFSTIKDDWIPSSAARDSFYQISEVKLYEFSSVLWGANPETPFLGFKGESCVEDAFDRIDKLYKALRTGNLLDETYNFLEIELNQIKSWITQLANKEPNRTTPNNVTNPKEEAKKFDSNIFIQHFKSNLQ